MNRSLVCLYQLYDRNESKKKDTLPFNQYQSYMMKRRMGKSDNFYCQNVRCASQYRLLYMYASLFLTVKWSTHTAQHIEWFIVFVIFKSFSRVLKSTLIIIVIPLFWLSVFQLKYDLMPNESLRFLLKMMSFRYSERNHHSEIKINLKIVCMAPTVWKLNIMRFMWAVNAGDTE